MSSRTCCRNVSLVLVLLAVAILAAPAFAGTADPTLCLQTQYNQVQKQKLNCSANDVRVAAVTNVRDLSGNQIATCVQGTKFSFVADFNVVTTANATNAGGRDNIGLYFQTDPTKTDALLGNTCTDNIIAPVHPCGTGTLAGISCGTPGYKEFDASPDTCGDTSSSVNANITDTIVVQDFVCTTSNSLPCPFDATKQCLSLPNCTSWQTPGSSILCVTNPTAYAYPFDASNNPEAIPGAPSKCNCSVIPLPIQIVNPKPLALKACNTPITSTTPTFTFDTNNPPGTVSPTADTNCDAGAEGAGTATYTVAIDNPNVSGAFGDIIVDQICDSAYGQVFPTVGSCKAGTVGAITGTNCSALDIPLGTFSTCTFTAASIGEDNSGVSNVVTVSGHSKVNTTVTFSTQTNQVTVHSSDAPAAATVEKTANATIAACATVRYGVEVDNTSGADEVETLSVLNDTPFGSITSVHNSVLATTCSVPQTIAVGGKYTCTFDAQFCSAVDANTCISNTDTVTATVKADEAGDATFDQVSNTLKVQECLTLSTPTP
jgi:hypothetical protein